MLLCPAFSEPNYISVDKQSKEQRGEGFIWWKMEHSANTCKKAPGHVIIKKHVQSSRPNVAFEMLLVHPCALDNNVIFKLDIFYYRKK